MSKQLRELEVGDEVVLYGRDHDRIATIGRLTKASIFLRIGSIVGSVSFKRDNGDCRTKSGFHRDHISVPTEDEVASIRAETKHRHAVRVLRNLDWSKMPLGALQNIIDIAKRSATL